MKMLFPNILFWMYVVLTLAEPPYVIPFKELENSELYIPPMDENKIPKFLNKPGAYKVVTKDTIVLPCEVYNPENFVLAWKKGIAILTAGTTKVTPEERIRIVEGYNLEIRNAQVNDAGNYICQIGTLDPVELKHTLQILIPPRIISITANGKVSAKKGSDVTLQCNSTGNPPPTITWTRKNNMLPNGDKTFVGNPFTIDSVRRQADGIYICTASNDIGTPVDEEIDLNILYPPEVKEEQSIVFTVEGAETEIVCIVHAEPKADVLWYRDTLQLDMTEWRITDIRGNRYTLRMRKVQLTDFGNYSCVADNGLGKSKRSIELTGRPDIAVISSPAQSRTKNTYEMLWTVKSHSPILEYKLLYRPVKTNKSSQEIQYKRPSMRRWDDDWTELLLNPPSTDQLEKKRTETLRNLDAGTKYEATVQSRNRYGWSEVSQSFFFTTNTKNVALPGNSGFNDPELRDMSVTAGSANTAAESIQGPLLCIISMVIYNTA